MTSRMLQTLGVTMAPALLMRAEGFAWDHEIQIALPSSYHQSNKAYPTLWVMDGSYQFDNAVNVANSYARSQIGNRLSPEMIVVGVGSPAGALNETQMRRDYDFSATQVRGFQGLGEDLLKQQMEALDRQMSAAGKTPSSRRGGAPGFLSFLIDQLRPVLAGQYRMADDHTLFGHSGGGYFCAYALFARPEGFRRYICGSPNLYGDNCALFEMEKHRAAARQDLSARVFFGVGESEILDDPFVSSWGCVSSTARMAEILGLRSYPSLKLSMRIFPREDHLSVIPLNLSWGLRAVWEGDVEAYEGSPANAAERS